MAKVFWLTRGKVTDATDLSIERSETEVNVRLTRGRSETGFDAWLRPDQARAAAADLIAQADAIEALARKRAGAAPVGLTAPTQSPALLRRP